jgi:chorismate dehydratase
MRPARVGAVSYLNTRPLVRGLDARPDLFTLRFDVPAVCAQLLHDGQVDLGLVPAIEYLQGDYAVVPGVAIGADGRVDSVAIFTTVPIAQVRTVAVDVSSRTSVALTRILCARHWQIRPAFIPAAPDVRQMLSDADAALVIGDPALAIDAAAIGAEKIDLAEAWRDFTGLPFVFAMWTGRPGAVDAEQVSALQGARDRGLAEVSAIAHEAAGDDPVVAAKALVYLRDTLNYGLAERERAGLERFHALAVELGLAPALGPLRFLP